METTVLSQYLWMRSKQPSERDVLLMSQFHEMAFKFQYIRALWKPDIEKEWLSVKYWKLKKSSTAQANQAYVYGLLSGSVLLLVQKPDPWSNWRMSQTQSTPSSL